MQSRSGGFRGALKQLNRANGYRGSTLVIKKACKVQKIFLKNNFTNIKKMLNSY